MFIIKYCALLGCITTLVLTATAKEEGCDRALGMENGDLTDSQLTSTNPQSPAQEARLNTGSGWVGTSDQSQYVRVDLGAVKTISAIALQGHGSYNTYTKTFRLFYSRDGLVWGGYSNSQDEGGGREAEELRGSTRRRDVIKVPLIPFEARYVAVNPRMWRGSPALRFEIYGCDPATPVTTTPTQITEDVQRRTVWKLTESPYVIGREIHVKPSAFLVIHAGVQVIFTSPEAGLVVNGVLKAEGNSERRVRFSSSRVPTETQDYGWLGIRSDSGEVQLSYTDVLQARTGVSGPAGRVTITNSRISLCGTGVNIVDGASRQTWTSLSQSTVKHCDYGVQVSGTPMLSYVNIANTNITRNKYVGLEIRDYVKSGVTDSLISHNSMHGVVMDSSYTTHLRFEQVIVAHNGGHGMALNLRGNFIPKKYLLIKKSKFMYNNFDGVNLKGEFGREAETWNILENVFQANNKSGLNVTLDAGSSGARALFIRGNTFSGHMTSNIPLAVVISGNFRPTGSYDIERNKFSKNLYGMFLKLDAQPQNYDTKISHNFFSHIFSGPALDVDADGSQILLNTFSSCESEEVIKIRRGQKNVIHNNTFNNPDAQYDLSLAVLFQLNQKINASFNYWGGRQSSHVRSRVQDFYANPDLIIATVSPFFTSTNRTTTSLGRGDLYYVDAFGLAGGQLIRNLTVRRGSLFRVGRTIHIFPNVSMTIEPGAKLLFKKLAGIYVEGVLKVLGSSSQTVSLLPEEPSLFPQWSGIRVYSADVRIQFTKISSAVACVQFTQSLPVKVLLTNVTCIHSNTGITGPISGQTTISLHNSKFSSIRNHGLNFSLGENLNFDLTISSTELSRCQKGALTLEDMGPSFKRVNANFKKISLLDNGRGMFFYTYENVELRFLLVDSLIQEQRGFALNLDSRVVKLGLSQNKFIGNQNGLYVSIRGKGDCEDKIRITDNEFIDSVQSKELQVYSYSGIGQCQLLISRNTFQRTKSQPFGGLYIWSMWFTRISVRNNQFDGIAGTALDVNAESGAQSVRVHNNTIVQCEKGLVVKSDDVQVEVTQNSFIQNYGSEIVDLKPVFSTPSSGKLSFSRNSLENNGNGTMVLLRTSSVALHYNIFSNPASSFNVKMVCDDCWGEEINATLNYWDAVASREISKKLYDKRSDSNLPKVAFTPYMRDRRLQTVYSASAKFVTGDRMLGGIVGGNVTLNTSQSPYTVASSIVIGPNDILTLEAGVTLLFYTNLALTVEGIWRVSGEKGGPVVLKPFITGSRWTGVEIIQTAEKANASSLNHLVLESTEHGLTVKGEFPGMDHVTSTGSSHSGMSVELADSPKFTVPRNLNMSFNSGPGISVKMNGASRAKFQLSGCLLTNNRHGLAIIEGGTFFVSRCTISHNSHSGIHVIDLYEGSLLIQASEFERNNANAVLSVSSQDPPRTGRHVVFQVSDSVFIDHDLSNSQSELRHLISIQNTAQKSGVWKISNSIFTKNKNMDHLMDMTFQNGNSSSHFVEINNSSFLDNEAGVLSFKHLDKSESDLLLVHNTLRNNVAGANSSVVKLTYRYNQVAKLQVTNNTFLKNLAENVLFVSLNGSDGFSDVGVFEDGKISENKFLDNNVRDVVRFSAYGLRFNNNTASNPRAKCELFAPKFHTSLNLIARYTFWGHSNLEAIVERICGFDMDMTRAIVDYLPYRRSEAWKDVSMVTPDPFSLESVYGGQIVLDTELSKEPNVYPIKRSIYIQDGATLIIPPGLHLRFDENRGIYVAGKLVIGRETKRTKLSALSDRPWNGLVFDQRYRKAATNIRLVGGATFREGRVEILHDRRFGTICDDEFGERVASVVCRMLGFDPQGKVSVYSGGHFGPGRGPILLDDLVCEGTEDSLEHCSHPGWGVQNCDHAEDVGVACHGEYLVKDDANRVSSLESVDIIDAKVAVTLKGPSVDISNCDIRHSTREGILVNSGLFPELDLKGTVVSSSGSHGLEVKRLAGISIKNVTVLNSGGRGISVRLSGGRLDLNHVTIRNSYDNGLRVLLRNKKEDHSVRIGHSVIADHSRGFGVYIESKKASLIQFMGNRFENNTDGSVYIKAGLLPYSSGNLNNREIILSKNVFNRSGANFVHSINNIHVTVTDNKFYNGHSKNKEDCLLNVGTQGENIAFISKHVNVSTNVFKGVQGHCVVKLNTGSPHTVPFNGEFLFNQILQSPVDSAVIVGSKRFNLSHNILDNPLADFELQVIARGNDILHAENNWWGVSELRKASSRIYDRKQDGTLLLVNIKPMMTDHIFDCSEVGHCSGNGECVSPDRCRCNAGWKGERCDDFSCSDIDDCSDHGRCVGPNQCHCRHGWDGSSCNEPTCFAVNSCSGHGVCHHPDVCTCYPEFTGRSCSDCSEDRWGPKCFPCPPCLHGHCDLNNGSCICDSPNWAGALCDECAPRFYGPDCRPDMHVTALIPNGGTNEGGTLVHVWGHNFPQSKTRKFYCRFGQKVVLGSWLSENHLTCYTPRNYATNVIVEVSADERQNFTKNELVFAYNGRCLLGSCGGYHHHGNCVFGECLCRMPWTGVNCASELLPPKISRVERSVPAVEGGRFTHMLQLTKRSQMTAWELVNSSTGLTIAAVNNTHAEVSWDTVPDPWTPETVSLTVRASNVIGSDTIKFEINAPYSYTVTVTNIYPSKLLQNPGQVQVKGYINFSTESTKSRTVKVDIMLEHAGELRPCDPVEVTVEGRQKMEQFRAVCHPRSGDSGFFRLVTRHPVIGRATPVPLHPQLRELGNWMVMGIRCTPDHVTREVYLHGNKAVLGGVTLLKNISPKSVYVKFVRFLGVDGLAMRNVSLVAWSSRTHRRFPMSLGSGEAQPIDIEITSNRPFSGKIQIVFKSLLGSVSRLTLDVSLRTRSSSLQTDPMIISEMVRPGSLHYYTIHLKNFGDAAIKNLKASVSPNSTFSIVSFSTSADLSQPVGRLRSHDNGSVMVSMAIPQDSPSHMLKGVVNLTSSAGESTIPILLKVVSGPSYLRVVVKDDLTRAEEVKSVVSGVTVSLISPPTGYINTLTTPSTGAVRFDNLSDGHYTLTVLSNQHVSPVSQVIHVTGPTARQVFLPRIPFSQKWTVERFGLEERQDSVNLSTAILKDSLPLMEVSPMLIDLSQYEGGPTNQSLEFLVTNKGQITAGNLRFLFPSEQHGVQFVSDKRYLGEVQSNSSLIVRLGVRVQTRERREIDQQGRELCGLALLYDFVTKDSIQTRRIDLTATRGRPAQAVLPCSVLQSETGENVDGDQNIFPANQIHFKPVTHLSCDCMETKVKRCSMDFQPMAGCGRALSDLGLSTNALAFVIGALDTAFTCVINVHCEKCKDLQSNIRCLTQTWEFCNATTRGQHSRGPGPLANALLSATKIDGFLRLITHIFGNEHIFFLKESAWFEKFKKSVWDSSDGGLYVTQKEFHPILNLAKVSTQGVLMDFLHRWNNTVSAWESGTPTTEGRTDVMAYSVVQSGWRMYQAETKAVRQIGYSSIFDQFDAALKIHLWESKQKVRTTCASASIQVGRSAVQVGEAVKVTVRLDNTEGRVLQNVKLELDFQPRGSSIHVNKDCFSVGKPSLSGIMGVDGTGRLATGITATSDWTIVPLNCSVASGQTLFYVGCKMSYQVERGDFDQDLSPNFLTVLPQENITLRLFYNKELFSNKPTSNQPKDASTVVAMVTNNGAGLCRNLSAISSRPNVTTSDGHPAPFKIAFTRLGGENALPTLLVRFGDVPSNTSSTAEWDITPNTSAIINSFDLTLANTDFNGNLKLTNITKVHHHHLFHRVTMMSVGDTPIPAFLVDDDRDNIPERLYEGRSVNLVHVVDQWSVLTVTFDRNEHKGTKRYSIIRIEVEVTKPQWGYVRVEDNMVTQVLSGNALLTAQCKTMQKTLPYRNSWSTSHIERKTLVHFIDYHGSSFHGNVQYELVFGPINSHYPVFNYTPSVFYVAEGVAKTEVLVAKATDQDGDSITYRLSQSERFSLDSVTGSLQRLKRLVIGQILQLDITATDNGVPSKSSSLRITVIVTKDGKPPPTTTPAVISPDYTPSPDGENVTYGARPNVTVTDLDGKAGETNLLIVYIVVGVVVGLLVVCAVACVAYHFCCKSKAKSSPKKKGKFDKYSAESVPMEPVRA